MSDSSAGRFAGKVAFVTGAGSGIGQATAIAFAKAGASVAAVDIAPKGLAETAEAIGQFGGKVLPITCDVTNSEQVQAALKQTIDAFGRLDAAFNNAGIEQPGAPITEVSEEFWNRIVGVNLTSVFLCMKYQIDLMLKTGGGAIVNTSSGAGVVGIQNQAAYCATKYGVIGMSKATALEFAARNVRVNALCPGIIDTPMIARYTGNTEEGRASIIEQEPVGRMGKPEEIANTVLWLCSEDSAFMTGHALVMDGGQTAGF